MFARLVCTSRENVKGTSAPAPAASCKACSSNKLNMRGAELSHRYLTLHCDILHGRLFTRTVDLMVEERLSSLEMSDSICVHSGSRLTGKQVSTVV
jgi:hypothetical protein